MKEVELLKFGRHFRITPGIKLVVGRNEAENNRLTKLLQPEDICFEPKSLPGPTGIGRGVYNDEVKLVAAQIIARYTGDGQVDVVVRNGAEQKEVLSVEGISRDRLEAIRI
jgi:predicted ribosome quality control (RQC) complex YloA/Tae2 family protein